MFERENWIGLALLAVCVVVGGVLVWTIATGETLSYDGPGWIPVVLAVLFVGGLVYSFVKRPKTRL